MKKIALFVIIGFFVTTTAFAQGAAVTRTINGIIIDNKNASIQNPATLADFVITLTKQSVLFPDSVESGFSIFADGKLTKFVQKSALKIKEFLEKHESTLAVTVTVKVIQKKTGEDRYILVSIENQK